MIKNWLNTLLAKPFVTDAAVLLLGVMLTFAFAPYEIFPLAVLAPAGLLALWLDTSPRRAFWLGFLFGAGLFGAGVSWVYHSIHVIGEVPVPLAVFITAGMVAILSLYPAFVGYFLSRFFPRTSKTKLVCAFPALWIFSEWLRSFLFTGFPWLLLGYSQTNSPLRGYAAILSVYGVSLAILLTSSLLLYGIMQYQEQKYRSVYLSLFAILAIWMIGACTSLIPWTRPEGKPVSVALVQGNIEQTIKWSPGHLQLSIDRYIQLSAPYWGKKDLIIWPESAIPLPLQNAEELIQQLDDKAQSTHTALVLGLPIRDDRDNGYWNTIVTLGKDKNVYKKRLLVPFGEYTPFYKYLAHTLNFLNIPLSNTIPGEPGKDTITIGNLKIHPSICYEIAFPALNWSPDKTISFLLSVTNDAWFGRSNAQAQHLQMAQMRALEFARPVLFVGNDGITAIIGPDGRIDQTVPQREAAVLSGSVQPRYGLTPWMRNGTDPVLFTAVLFLVIAFYARKKESSIDNENTIPLAKRGLQTT